MCWPSGVQRAATTPASPSAMLQAQSGSDTQNTCTVARLNRPHSRWSLSGPQLMLSTRSRQLHSDTTASESAARTTRR